MFEIPDEDPVVGDGGVVVLEGRGPGEENRAAGYTRDHGSARGRSRHVLHVVGFHCNVGCFVSPNTTQIKRIFRTVDRLLGTS